MRNLRTRNLMRTRTRTRPSVVCAFDYAFVVLVV